MCSDYCYKGDVSTVRQHIRTAIVAEALLEMLPNRGGIRSLEDMNTCGNGERAGHLYCILA